MIPLFASVSDEKAGPLQARVDASDLEELLKYKWYFRPRRKGCLGFYAYRTVHGKYLPMHRVLLGKPPSGKTIDHINGDGLDNRKSNLRLVSHQANCLNRVVGRRNRSGEVGVFKSKNGEKWVTQIFYKKKCLSLGVYGTKKEAVKVRRIATRIILGLV
jgi:hypothetical protein